MRKMEHKILSQDTFCGKWHYVYACDKCGKPVEKKHKIQDIHYALCPECQRDYRNSTRREKYKETGEYDRGFHIRTLEELDLGTIYALYRARRTIKWIADDQMTDEETVKAALDKIFNKGD